MKLDRAIAIALSIIELRKASNIAHESFVHGESNNRESWCQTKVGFPAYTLVKLSMLPSVPCCSSLGLFSWHFIA